MFGSKSEKQGKPQSTAADRRRYFRVNDTLAMRYSRCEADADVAALLASSDMNGISDRLREIDQQISQALDELRKLHPQVVPAMELLNKKLNTLDHWVQNEGVANSEDKREVMKVSLSACGLAFPTAEALPVNATLLTDMLLFPGNVRLAVKARVVACDRQNDGESAMSHLVRVDFYDLTDEDQERLVQHVIKCQARLLKEAREARQAQD